MDPITPDLQGKPDAIIPTQGVVTAQAQGAGVDYDNMSTAELAKLVRIASKEKKQAENEAAKSRLELKSINDEKVKNAEEEAKKRGEHEKLYLELKNQHDPLLKRVQEMETAINSLLTDRLALLTEEETAKFDSLFGDILDPVKKLDKFTVWSKDIKRVNAIGTSIGAQPASQVIDSAKTKKILAERMAKAKLEGNHRDLEIIRREFAALPM